jgi:hypothetical protein
MEARGLYDIGLAATMRRCALVARAVTREEEGRTGRGFEAGDRVAGPGGDMSEIAQEKPDIIALGYDQQFDEKELEAQPRGV